MNVAKKLCLIKTNLLAMPQIEKIYSAFISNDMENPHPIITINEP